MRFDLRIELPGMVAKRDVIHFVGDCATREDLPRVVNEMLLARVSPAAAKPTPPEVQAKTDAVIKEVEASTGKLDKGTINRIKGKMGS
jgi:hypothetical protein